MKGVRGNGEGKEGGGKRSAGGRGDGPAAGERRAVKQRRIGTASDFQKEGFDKGLIVIFVTVEATGRKKEGEEWKRASGNFFGPPAIP